MGKWVLSENREELLLVDNFYIVGKDEKFAIAGSGRSNTIIVKTYITKEAAKVELHNLLKSLYSL